MKKQLKSPVSVSSSAISELGRRFSDATILLHEAIARYAGLAGTDHKYLGLLLRQGPLTAGEWATHTGLSTGAITGLIDRLEKQGLVVRQPAETDRRKVVVVPNAARAQHLLGPAFAPLQRDMEQLVGALNEAEAATIERYLLAAMEVMQAHTQRLQGHQTTPESPQ